MGVLLKAANEKEKREWETNRIGWFYSLIAPGLSKAKKPTDLMIFDWEKNKKEVRKVSKEQIDKRAKKVEEWLNNR